METSNNHLKILLFSLLAVAVASLFAACGGGDSWSPTAGNNATGTTLIYSGPGSKWDVTLNTDDTFEITHRLTVSDPVDMTVTGTYDRQSNGLVILTVDQAVDASDTVLSSPANGDQAWAIDAPGYAFLLRPMGSSDQLIPMVTAGTCPTEDIDANWVIVKADASADATNPGRDWLGTFYFTAATEAADLPERYSLANPTSNLGAQSLGSGSCTDGILTVSPGSSNEGVMYLATNGAIVQTGTFTTSDDTDDNIIFGLSKKAISDVNNLDGTYGGMLFDDNNITGDKIVPVGMTCSAGVCTGVQIDTADFTTTLAGTVTIDLTVGAGVDQPGTGLVAGTISDGASTGTLACMVDIDAAGSGQKLVSCVGQSPGDATQNAKLFNVLFVSY